MSFATHPSAASAASDTAAAARHSPPADPDMPKPTLPTLPHLPHRPRLLSLLGQRWRNIGTALSFAVFGLGGLTLAFVAIPALHVIGRVRSRRNPDLADGGIARADIAQRCISASFRFYIRFMRALRVLDYGVENAGRLREDEGTPLLVVANHPSLLDYVFLAAHMPLCDCIVKESVATRNPFTRRLTRLAGYIPNHNAGQLLEACRARLDQGRRILIFPEGTRSTPGQPVHLLRGAAHIAIRCRVPLRVVRITCEPPVLTKTHKWWETAPVRPFFHITVGEKIDITPYPESADDPSAPARSPGRAARLLTRRLRIALDPHSGKSTTHSSTHSSTP
ncbi:MAG: 1-acyl-sn-glycerol-3-phosphate acyltransferase [Opitutaceae bacterium]|nr:1-acyl-sn-glycerol-3-phosphate acyltransferase [Opitutaceae bacterium]